MHAGVGKEDSQMYITQHKGKSNTLSQGANTIAQVTVPVHKLDTFFAHQKITFLKADIEGFELDMLTGAEQIIKRDKPKLALCVYHKVDDLINIVNKLKNLVPEYKFFLRHHSPHISETVLYCKIDIN